MACDFSAGFPALQLKAAFSSCAQVKTHRKQLCKQEQDTKITSPSGYEQQQAASSSWIWRSWRREWLREREREIAEVSSLSVRLWCRWPSTSPFHFLFLVFLCALSPVRELKMTVHHQTKILSLFTHAHVLFGAERVSKYLLVFFRWSINLKKQSVCDDPGLQIVTQPSVSPQVKLVNKLLVQWIGSCVRMDEPAGY